MLNSYTWIKNLSILFKDLVFSLFNLNYWLNLRYLLRYLKVINIILKEMNCIKKSDPK